MKTIQSRTVRGHAFYVLQAVRRLIMCTQVFERHRHFAHFKMAVWKRTVTIFATSNCPLTFIYLATFLLCLPATTPAGTKSHIASSPVRFFHRTANDHDSYSSAIKSADAAQNLSLTYLTLADVLTIHPC